MVWWSQESQAGSSLWMNASLILNYPTVHVLCLVSKSSLVYDVLYCDAKSFLFSTQAYFVKRLGFTYVFSHELTLV